MGVRCPSCLEGRMETTKLPKMRAGTKIQKAVMRCNVCGHKEVFK